MKAINLAEQIINKSNGKITGANNAKRYNLDDITGLKNVLQKIEYLFYGDLFQASALIWILVNTQFIKIINIYLESYRQYISNKRSNCTTSTNIVQCTIPLFFEKYVK